MKSREYFLFFGESSIRWGGWGPSFGRSLEKLMNLSPSISTFINLGCKFLLLFLNLTLIWSGAQLGGGSAEIFFYTIILPVWFNNVCTIFILRPGSLSGKTTLNFIWGYLGIEKHWMKAIRKHCMQRTSNYMHDKVQHSSKSHHNMGPGLYLKLKVLWEKFYFAGARPEEFTWFWNCRPARMAVQDCLAISELFAWYVWALALITVTQDALRKGD